jgi:hypothetical protein
MGVHWSLKFLQKFLPPDLWDGLYVAQNDPYHNSEGDATFPIYNGTTGELIKSIDAAGTRRFSRRKLRAYLNQGAGVQVCAYLFVEVYSISSPLEFELNTGTIEGLMFNESKTDGTNSSLIKPSKM